MNVVTICGSVRFMSEIFRQAERLTLEGNIVFIPTVATKVWTKEEENMIVKAHLEKIKISDWVFIVNVGGYVGEGTAREIRLARELHKPVIYLENYLVRY